MAIVIKEIILSDTIEKFMEKVNFNFDQLMLAGGGPQGPQGNIGPIGPIGPVGDPGNKWYVGCTGTTAAIGGSLFMGDLFLQKGSCGIGTTYPLGEVLEFDSISQIFVPTGLNLRGPTGPTGSTGESTGWSVYPGVTEGTIYQGGETAGDPGATASFVLLKGDTLTGVTGDAEYPGYSRDSLYLGGYHGMYNQSSVYPLDLLPKLFVSPKSLVSASVFDADIGGGKAGNGIALIREPDKSGAIYTPINPYSYSNIFIDDDMNLNITNFSDYSEATIVESTITNDINLMGKSGIKLIGGHYQASNAGGLLEVSSALKTELFPDTSAVFPSGGPGFHLRSEGTLNTGTISLGDTNQLRIISERTSANGNSVDTAYWANVTLLSPNNKYRIGIGANDKYQSVVTQNLDMPFIGSGTFDDSTTEYIGLGNKPTGNKAPTLSTFNYSSKDFVLIGNPNGYDPSTDLGTITDKSIDIYGQLRMRYSASATGQVLLTTDNKGTAEWSSTTSLGAWKNDDNCDTKIIIDLRATRFASFEPDSGAVYTRVDIPSMSGDGTETDLYFGDSSYNGGDERAQQGHIINKRYEGPGNNGTLAISTGLLDNCPDSITGREMQSTSTVSPRLQAGSYGEIVIGNLTTTTSNTLSLLGVVNDVKGVSESTPLKYGLLTDSLKIYKSRTTTQTSGIDSTARFNRANIHLINTTVGEGNTDYGDYINPKIKFTPNDANASEELMDGDFNGFNSTTAFEVLRYYGAQSAGPANIRFSGVGKSTKLDNDSQPSIGGANPSPNTTGRGEDIGIGAHVMMIGDTDSKNKFDEQGKASDYYELVDSDLYVSNLSATFVNQGNKGGSLPMLHQYKEYEFARWGSQASGWNNMGATGYTKFQGSRTINLNINSFNDLPNGINLNPSSILWQPLGTQTVDIPAIPTTGSDFWEPDALNTWLSPTTGVRFSPINLSVPTGTNQTGLSWVDFNIDMGLIFETDSQGEMGSWTDGYAGIGYGLGSFSSIAFGLSRKAAALTGSFKVKHLKIKMDPDNLGITSFLDNLDHTRRRDPLTAGSFTTDQTNNSAVAQAGEYYTDWYVGQVKPMNNLRGLGKTATDNYYTTPGKQHIDSSGGMPWTRYSDTFGKTHPFASDQTSVPGSITSQYTEMDWSGLSDVNWFADSASSFANTNKYTNFMWRIYTIYGDSEDTPEGCYLEIYCTPDAHRSYNEDFQDANGLITSGNYWLTIDEASGSSAAFLRGTTNDDTWRYGMQQQRGGFYPTVLTMFNKYISDTTEDELINLEPLLTWANRTDSFYGSHGFSLSGQATVKWNRAANAW